MFLLLMVLFATGVQAEESGGAMAIANPTFDAGRDIGNNLSDMMGFGVDTAADDD